MNFNSFNKYLENSLNENKNEIDLDDDFDFEIEIEKKSDLDKIQTKIDAVIYGLDSDINVAIYPNKENFAESSVNIFGDSGNLSQFNAMCWKYHRNDNDDIFNKGWMVYGSIKRRKNGFFWEPNLIINRFIDKSQCENFPKPKEGFFNVLKNFILKDEKYISKKLNSLGIEYTNII